MIQRVTVLFLLIILITIHTISLRKADETAKESIAEQDTSFVISVPVLRITALEFRGIASDFMFLRALVFIGSTFERSEKPRVKTWEWKWVYNVLTASAGLDPYFYDPYYLANANLTWSAGMIQEANSLLLQGTQYRDWDWSLPFYAGFNYYYFLKDEATATKYLMESSRRPEGSPIFASIASKLAYEGGRTENAILFLEEIAQRTNDEDEKKYFETRISSLRAIQILEDAVAKFKKKFHRLPADTTELVSKGIIRAVPHDPYKGTYFLDENGIIKSTSDALLLPYHR